MIELETSISDKLTVLGIAQERYAKAQEQLERAEFPYTHAISVLMGAMAEDDTVLQAKQMADEYRDLYEAAKGEAEEKAIEIWESGETEGRKEWSQDHWEIRLKTAKTPRPFDIPTLFAHLAELKAVGSAVKSVTLNKADTVRLHESLDGGIRGLEVEERTTASLRQV